MRFFLFGMVVLLFSPAAFAQDPEAYNANLDIIDNPICFNVINEAPYGVVGTIISAQYMRPSDGTISRHRSNFRLDAPGGLHDNGNPSDRLQACFSGPFMEGRTLEINIKTLIPIFACQTRIDMGDLIIKGYRKPEGGAKTWIECYNPDGTKTGEPEHD